LTPEDWILQQKFHCSWLETCSIDVYMCASEFEVPIPMFAAGGNEELFRSRIEAQVPVY
jgi:hypothetical protein